MRRLEVHTDLTLLLFGIKRLFASCNVSRISLNLSLKITTYSLMLNNILESRISNEALEKPHCGGYDCYRTSYRFFNRVTR